VRTYAVLCGLTPLVPVPFLDDLVRGYFRRRLVRELATARGQTLSPADLWALTAEPEKGCLSGCLLWPFVYLLKRLFRKIFYFLEWKRAVDIASDTYHFGSLVDHAFERGWLAPAGPYDAARIRAGIEAVLAQQSTRPVETAFRETFRRSKGALVHAARALRRALGGVRREAADEQIKQAVESIAREEAHTLDGVAGELDDALAKLPPGYLDGLCERLARALEAAPPAPGGVPPEDH
jgi:hypothetical protein